MSSKYLIYTCCFHQESYTDVLVYLINSFKNTGSTVDFVVYTTSELKALIQSKCADLTGVQFFEKNFYKSMNQARISKLDIFDYPSIDNYEKVIYIDADSIFVKDPLPMFDSIQDDLVYVFGEGNILSEAEYWGRSLFLKENPSCVDREGLASFIMGFKNIPAIKKMFIKTKQDFYLDMYQNKLKFYDQPFLNFFFINNNMCNADAFKKLVRSRESAETAIREGLFAVHFAGCPGHGNIKVDLMKEFQTSLNGFAKPNVVVNDTKAQAILLLQQQMSEMNAKLLELLK
jgi:lipopolysaccharide biosynthesis glycosyltransferase